MTKSAGWKYLFPQNIYRAWFSWRRKLTYFSLYFFSIFKQGKKSLYCRRVSEWLLMQHLLQLEQWPITLFFMPSLTLSSSSHIQTHTLFLSSLTLSHTHTLFSLFLIHTHTSIALGFVLSFRHEFFLNIFNSFSFSFFCLKLSHFF
jgi:hypothetical protein